ncbi:MAG: epoxyqueuosine reductase QueH [Patescibacteria group bacterium]|nr:epoxyqueuosine reductase QueH [Patescibacteria group bacterium]MDD4304740.1 epoxyqueuosine reductase QueH [Patescibacteria group bacterium]MDD4695505.1 epoxyqueuosine reductase QueH [Patescibacteria group bacterium]
MKLLLHVCCAPCSAYVIQQLQKDYDVNLFYFNPNICPESEYEIRKNESQRYAKNLEIEFIENKIDHNIWLKKIEGLENEPERGRRCLVCYKYRLEETAKYAKDNGFDIFTTTLSISPHKSSEIINLVGNEISKQIGVEYLQADWKKDGGFQKSCEISKENKFYRQQYCGCEFSINPAKAG